MTAQQIFGLQVLLSFLVYGLVARWYVIPWLAPRPLHAALQPLLVLHATRYLGMVFLVPTVVGPALPAGFAVPAAYGDLLAALLALAALVALRARAPIALPLTWLFNVVGLLDSSTRSIRASGTTCSSAPRTSFPPSRCPRS